jgi:hypothetical protein
MHGTTMEIVLFRIFDDNIPVSWKLETLLIYTLLKQCIVCFYVN